MNIHPDNRSIQDWSWIQSALEDEANRAAFMCRPSVMLGVKPVQDGNAWLAIYGDLPSGVVGSGDSPELAMADFDRAWYANQEAK